MSSSRHSVIASSHPVVALALSISALVACGEGSDDRTAIDPATPANEALDAAAIADIESKADRLVAAGVPGVSVAILAGEQQVLVTRGVADRATGEAVSPDHRFRVASVSKSVLAAVVLQLVDEGEIALDDTVDEWLPGLIPANGDATIEQLLRLESGIFNFEEDERHMAPYYAGDFAHSYQPEELVALAASHPPLFAPGERFHYSNTNYVLLGLIIEKITGRPLDEVVRERIVAPLGMASTSMPISSQLEAPYARGYMLGLGEDFVDVTGISASSVFGNGNLVSTPRDLVVFYRALARGEIVSPELLPVMVSLDPEVPETHYAMGLWRFDDEFPPCGTFVGHDGASPGYDGTAFTRLDGERQYAVWTNSLAPGDVVGDDEAQGAYHDLVIAAGCN